MKELRNSGSAGEPDAGTVQPVIDHLRLDERKSQLGRQLSGGEQEMLAIARPLLLNPNSILLDEPSQGACAAHRQGGEDARIVASARIDLEQKTLQPV